MSISDKIKKRLELKGDKFFCNDNISSVMENNDIDQLIPQMIIILKIQQGELLKCLF